MFNYINGTVAELQPNLAVVDCGGIGFEMNSSAYTVSRLKVGEKAKLFVYTYIREDCFELFGFSSVSEKHCFEMLLGVSGVGPKAAIAILSTAAPENIILSIISGDDKALSAAQGVGKKIAQRIILELKDKLAKETQEISFRGDTSDFSPAAQNSGKLGDASSALAVLGYNPAEISAALKKLDLENLSLEEIIRAALKQMIN